jgi:hypothetical protein
VARREPACREHVHDGVEEERAGDGHRESARHVAATGPRVGKPVIFLFGNIHPPESEAAEALQMVARDLAAGTRANLLQNQIVIIAPIFNVDGTDTLVPQTDRSAARRRTSSGRAKTPRAST